MPPSNTSDTSLEASIATTPYLEQFAELASPVPDLAATLTTQAEQDANDDNVSFLRMPSSAFRGSLARAVDSPPPVNLSSRAVRVAGAASTRRAIDAAERPRRHTPTQLQEPGGSNSVPSASQIEEYLRRHEWGTEASDYDQDEELNLVQSLAALENEVQPITVPQVSGSPSHARNLHLLQSADLGTADMSGDELYSPPYLPESSARSSQPRPRISQPSRIRYRSLNSRVSRETVGPGQDATYGEFSMDGNQSNMMNGERDRTSQSTGDGESSGSIRVTGANPTNSLTQQPRQSQQNRQRQIQEISHQFLSFHQQQQQQRMPRQLQQQRQREQSAHHQLQQNQGRHSHQHSHLYNLQHDRDQQLAYERQLWTRFHAGQHRFRPSRISDEVARLRYLRNPENPQSSTRSLDDAIKYLERLRFCESIQESLSSAEAGGFTDQFSAGTDFILDTTDIEPPPQTSWLEVGGEFSGSQHAVLSHNFFSSSHYDNRHSDATNFPQLPATSVSSSDSPIDQSSRASRTNVTAHINSKAVEQWPVKVRIQSIDYNSMTLAGIMEASNVPDKSWPPHESSVTTYFEGEIIDFKLYTLETKNFHANTRIDGTYWRKLEPFKKLTDDEIVRALLSKKWLANELSKNWILMRWKEKCFVNPSDATSSLSISGFYYVSLRREDGHVEGLYHDPSSTPYQRLSLTAEKKSFPVYRFQ